MSSDEHNKSDYSTNVNPSVSNIISGIYGSVREPLYPTTRSAKRQLMESTISDLLDKLDYTGYKYGESKKKCKRLKNLVDTKNEEIQFLVNEVLVLKKQKQDMLDDYHDLFNRYHQSKK